LLLPPAAQPHARSASVEKRAGDLAALGLDRPARLHPCLEAAGEVVGVEAGLAEGLGGEEGPAAGAAAEDDRAVAVELGGPARQLLEGDVGGAGDAARLPLVALADVDELGAVVDLRLGGVGIEFGRCLGVGDGARIAAGAGSPPLCGFRSIGGAPLTTRRASALSSPIRRI
jgi:hypothetical protein